MPIVQPWGSSQVKGLNTKPLIMDFSIPRMPAEQFFGSKLMIKDFLGEA